MEGKGGGRVSIEGRAGDFFFVDIEYTATRNPVRCGKDVDIGHGRKIVFSGENPLSDRQETGMFIILQSIHFLLFPSLILSFQNQSWSHNNEQVVLLLENIMKQLKVMESIENTARSRYIDDIVIKFPSLIDHLLGSIMIEIEDNCLQIKQFMYSYFLSSLILYRTSLGDIDAAMKQASLECSQLLHEKVDSSPLIDYKPPLSEI